MTDLLEADALRAFAVFATHRNFTTAAAELHISQPALHVKIRKLAAGLGVDLYERDGRRLVLTSAGQRLAAFAADTRQRTGEFLRDLHHGRPELAVAAGRSTFRWVISDAVRRTGADGWTVRITVADRDAALAALASGRVDVAVVGFDPPPRSVESRHVATYPQILVVAATHPLAARATVRVRDLAGLDLLVPPPERPHRRSLDRALADAGVAWRPVAEVDGWDLLVHFAALGLGATVVNGCVPVPDGLAAVPVTDLPAVRYWAAWRKHRHADPPPFVNLLASPR